MEVAFTKPQMSYSEIQDFRKKSDCLMIDIKKLNSKDSFIVDDEFFDQRLQPLRLIVLNLKTLDRSWSVLNDHFKRNTMIIASDKDVRENQEIVRFLESQGVALLMARANEDETLALDGVMKSLTSLRLKNLLVEDQIDLLPELLGLRRF